MNWKSLLRDLFILVAGILLSLSLNECRQNVLASEDENRIMLQLIDDIAADTVLLQSMLKELTDMSEFYEPLYFNEKLEDYERYGIASSVVFIPFQPNKTAMLELSFSNRSGDIKRRDLVAKATALHESYYKQLKEITELVAEYVTQQHVPFIADNLFYSPDTTFEPEEVQQIASFVNSDSFRQRINWLEILWQNQLIYAQVALDEARTLLLELKSVYE